MAATNSVIILRGGGRHGAVTYEQILDKFPDTPTFLWDDSENVHPSLSHLKRFKPDDDNQFFSQVTKINCYVAVGSGKVRSKLVESVRIVFKEDKRLSFPNLIHKTAVISPFSNIGNGNFFGPFSLVNTCATIGDFCLVNSAALVEHDCRLGNFVTLNPGSILLGSVKVDSFSTIGASAVIRDDCFVSSESVIGMCAAVVKSVNEERDGFWVGVPAKRIPANKKGQSSAAAEVVGNLSIRWCVKKAYSSQRIQRYLEPSLRAGHLTNDGPLQPIVTDKLKALVRCTGNVLMACSGTGALHALAAGLSLRSCKHLRWVTQTFTFPSSIQGPLADSLVCDIDPQFYGPSFDFLNEHKNSFEGVIVTNVFGLQTGIVEYEQWCIRESKLLIFDNAASAIGFLDDGRSIHDIGDGAIISLHETKPFGRGEGGAIICRRDVSSFVHQAMNFGFDIPRQIRIPNRFSSNWRMSDIGAAAICDHFDEISENDWEGNLNDLSQFAGECLQECGLQLAIPIRYPTILSCLFVKLRPGMDGEVVCRQLNAHGIEAKHYYVPILLTKSEAPVAWSLFDSTICLPFHLGISKADIAAMLKLI